jgi:hypothetical protein
MTSSLRWPTTTTSRVMPAPRHALSTWASIGRPHTSCSTLGSSLFMRVLLPAARMMAAVSTEVLNPVRSRKTRRVARPIPILVRKFQAGDARRRQKLPDQDSNLERQDQNLVCYQLHHRVVISPHHSKAVGQRPLAASGRPIQDGPFADCHLRTGLSPLLANARKRHSQEVTRLSRSRLSAAGGFRHPGTSDRPRFTADSVA